MHINEDGSKTMGDRDQKIIHRWNHESQKSTWTTVLMLLDAQQY
jgi:hypothetical protein